MINNANKRSLTTTKRRHRGRKRKLQNSAASVKRRRRKFSVFVTCKKRPQIDSLKLMNSVQSALSKNVRETPEKPRDRPSSRRRK